MHLDGHGAPAGPGTDGVLKRAEYEVREGFLLFLDGMGLSCLHEERRRGVIVGLSSGAVGVEARGVEKFQSGVHSV